MLHYPMPTGSARPLTPFAPSTVLAALAVLIALTAATLAACGTDAATSGPDSGADIAQTGTIATGELDVPAATSFEEPGFHLAFERTHTVPMDLAPPAGAKLVVRMWDASRPDQACATEHPLSGCATIDWSDAMGRPNVPDTGVFDNRITVEDGSGPRDFYLTETRGLADTPDPYLPS